MTDIEETEKTGEQPREVHHLNNETLSSHIAAQPNPSPGRSPETQLPYSQTPNSLVSQRLKRPVMKPARLMDYISGDKLSDDEILAHLALFTHNDPI